MGKTTALAEASKRVELTCGGTKRATLVLALLPAPTKLSMTIAKVHDRSWKAMRDFLKLGVHEDPDFWWPWKRSPTSHLLATPSEQLAELFSWSGSYVAQARPPGIVMGDVQHPFFRLCWKCVAEAHVVHYRAEFRFTFLRFCPRHQVELVTPDCWLLEDVGDGWSDIAHGRSAPTAPPTSPQQLARWEFERRMCRLLKFGYERHPQYGVVPAQAIISQQRYRLAHGL
ncbi:TniQ family protein [Variovorax sp. HW608]|uniref:TniQ family protein n=1 Tax=Variovorax sp. HW608 TaxID=1034889 RepID=UPI000B5AFD13|nr:TniQ family protein [Variovorax sp. HW608]